MAGKGLALMRPVWMKQAEEAKLKEEEEKAAAARAAFEATFNDVDQTQSKEEPSSDSEAEEAEKLANKPVGPVDASKCTAAGTGVGGGAAGAAASFVVITKDADCRRVSHGGASMRVKVAPGPGVGGVEQEAVVKDHGDGTYTATYAVAKRGDYMVSVECNGQPISGSPFPVFFSGGSAPLGGSLLPSSGTSSSTSSFMNGMNQGVSPFPNMMTGIFPGMLALIPGILPGATGGAILPGLGASFGEVCRDYLNGRCVRADCKYNHPPQNQLMAALAAGSTMGGLSQMPMNPSAAAMAAAQSIAVAQAYQAAQAQAVAQQQQAATKESRNETMSVKEQEKKIDLSKTIQITNLHRSLTSEQLRQLFAYCGTVTNCEIDSSKQIAYVEYSKLEEAKAGLALNNLEVGGRSLKVEPAKSPQPKPAEAASTAAPTAAQPPPLPMMMQQAVAMQQLQFQQALLMQQAMASQQAAARAATVKSAADMAAARAAEISKRLKGDDGGQEDEKAKGSDRSRSRSRSRSKSKSRSRSPIKYRRGRRSRSLSPIRYRRDFHRGSSYSRDYYPHRSHSRDRGSYYRGGRDSYYRYYGRREWDRERERDHHTRSSRRSRSRSRMKRRSRTNSGSPHHRSLSPNQSPAIDVSKSKSVNDESTHHKKSSSRHKKKNREHSSSPDVRHKKKHREHSSSPDASD
ncbi:hypothetical protein O6H91_05G023500 [Diphasiastrum complanatum]|uniref:Uncharacterized protein n=2 Tax=Diphasiastrum complanatum TaxID=34168 RepID=A0ACC2DLU1_DIPCM|nr:hypothetical protein O6H91_Y283000 [Diphasiastrum complanatum]KAJ7555130.1 hypothetical protein O6H91_05G023500 [Diphasiastrum complanatum]